MFLKLLKKEHSAEHPGWKAVAEHISEKQGISIEAANRILGAQKVEKSDKPAPTLTLDVPKRGSLASLFKLDNTNAAESEFGALSDMSEYQKGKVELDAIQHVLDHMGENQFPAWEVQELKTRMAELNAMILGTDLPYHQETSNAQGSTDKAEKPGFSKAFKMNEHHDAQGRFTSAGASGVAPADIHAGMKSKAGDGAYEFKHGNQVIGTASKISNATGKTAWLAAHSSGATSEHPTLEGAKQGLAIHHADQMDQKTLAAHDTATGANRQEWTEKDYNDNLNSMYEKHNAEFNTDEGRSKHFSEHYDERVGEKGKDTVRLSPQGYNFGSTTFQISNPNRGGTYFNEKDLPAVHAALGRAAERYGADKAAFEDKKSLSHDEMQKIYSEGKDRFPVNPNKAAKAEDRFAEIFKGKKKPEPTDENPDPDHDGDDDRYAETDTDHDYKFEKVFTAKLDTGMDDHLKIGQKADPPAVESLPFLSAFSPAAKAFRNGNVAKPGKAQPKNIQAEMDTSYDL